MGKQIGMREAKDRAGIYFEKQRDREMGATKGAGLRPIFVRDSVAHSRESLGRKLHS